MSPACAAHKEINVLHSGDIQVFIKAVHSVLKDDGFQLPTPMVVNAPNNILEWSSHACSLMIFGKTLVQYLRHCLPETSRSAGVERMWEIFHKLRTSKHFHALYYAAGFIPRALSKKIQWSNHSRKQELQLCLV